MPVIGITFDKITGERKKSVVNEAITTNSSPKILDIKEREIEQLGKKALAMKFEFLTTYAPEIGEIKIDGELLYLTDEHKKLLDLWKKDKKLTEDSSVEILNTLFRRCLLKAADLADELQLPLPLRFPIVTKGQPQQEEQRQEDPSVA